MKEGKSTVKTSAGKENEPITESTSKKKTKEDKPSTKVVVRRLPHSMTEEQFKMQVAPMPDHDYFYFVPADMSLMPNAFSRAYINFIDQNDLFIFTEKFDGYVFVDSKGGEFPAIVEFAPFQRIPKNRPTRKKDSKVGTIEADPIYIAFKERLEADNLENKTATNVSKQHFFETSSQDKKEEVNNTPLLDFIRNKRAERQKLRDEKREEKRKKDLERRKAKEEQRKVKKEDEPVVKVLNSSQTLNKDRPKEKEGKPSFVKKKSEDGKPMKEKPSSEIRSKDSKRTGKSYLEERQRLAERREEQRKKLSQGQSNISTTNAKPTSSQDDGGNSIADEEKSAEDVTASAESKTKEFDHKKPERVFKREERRSSYKYEKYDSRRDRDEDSRRLRRGSERNYQGSKREEERSEDGARKKYSESRRGHDSSQRDRYKEKDKIKAYNPKKNETIEIERKSKSGNENVDNSEKRDIENSPKVEDDSAKKSKSDMVLVETTSQDQMEIESQTKQFDSMKPTRRKSMDLDKAKSYSKSYPKEKNSEKKRRNSMGSPKHHVEKENRINNSNTKEEVVQNGTSGTISKMSEQENVSAKELVTTSLQDGTENTNFPDKVEIKNVFEDVQRKIPKRRNSTGGQEPEVISPRRNSLGSEDKNKVVTFKEQDGDGALLSEKEKPKEEIKKKQNSRDPRTERKIRNKDRPSLEIYRPGMGRFSKQRLEREKEKGLGSSTEVDSPSPSPSPTPQLKLKSSSSN